MNLRPIESWLAAHTGLVADRLGPGQLARVVRDRQRATGLPDAAAYVSFLLATPGEQGRFVAAIVVNETWFFRDREVLDGVVRQALASPAARAPDRKLQVLSVPCSSGEEPYSLAMAFALAGWPASRLSIEAVDISADIIEQALAGLYRRNAFRGLDPEIRSRFFEALPGDVWRVRSAVREGVCFGCANLLADNFVPGRAPYDIVLCRNLLIYFDAAEQARAFRTLGRLLAEDGVLAVGPAEGALALNHGFSPVPGESTLLFRRAAARTAARVAVRRTPVRSTPPAPPIPPVAGSPMRLPAAAAVPSVGTPAPVAVPPWDEVRALADAGRLREAAERGEALLRSGPPAPELCHLLAVVSEANGAWRRAEELHRKTLYLDPRHAGSLAHLALLLEKRGDAAAAAVLRVRARRGAKPEAVWARRGATSAGSASERGATVRVRNWPERCIAGTARFSPRRRPGDSTRTSRWKSSRRGSGGWRRRRRTSVAAPWRWWFSGWARSGWRCRPPAGAKSGRRGRSTPCRTGGTARCSAWRTSAAN